jgi:cytochrome P450
MSDVTAGYDPFDPAVLADPFPVYAALRERCPVHHHPGFGERGFYTVTRYDDVVALSKDVDRWSADWGQGPIYVKEGGLRSDPPEHTRYRRLITGAFTPSRTAALTAFVEASAGALVDRFAAAGEVDLVGAFAVPLPLDVIAHVLGVPADRGAEFKAWSDEFMAGQNNADPEVQGAARAKIDAYFVEELGQRRGRLAAAPGADPMSVLPDDVLTSLLLADNDGRPFTDDELLPLLLLLLVGGNETTTSLLGNLVRRLLELGLWEQVVADPSLWDAAIEESLRLDPPVLGLFRTAQGDQHVHGVTVPADAKVQGLYAAANRDPAVFERPDSFRLDRTAREARQHLSFGVGIWFCPGAALARIEARAALRQLGERLPGLRLVGAVERTDSFMMWGPKALPVRWDV